MRVEYSFLLVQRWKLVVIMQQLQVTNFSANLGRSQAGNLLVANMSGTIGKVRQRLCNYFFKFRLSVRMVCDVNFLALAMHPIW